MIYSPIQLGIYNGGCLEMQSRVPKGCPKGGTLNEVLMSYVWEPQAQMAVGSTVLPQMDITCIAAG